MNYKAIFVLWSEKRKLRKKKRAFPFESRDTWRGVGAMRAREMCAQRHWALSTWIVATVIIQIKFHIAFHLSNERDAGWQCQTGERRVWKKVHVAQSVVKMPFTLHSLASRTLWCTRYGMTFERENAHWKFTRWWNGIKSWKDAGQALVIHSRNDIFLFNNHKNWRSAPTDAAAQPQQQQRLQQQQSSGWRTNWICDRMTINYIKCFCSGLYLLTVDVTFTIPHSCGSTFYTDVLWCAVTLALLSRRLHNFFATFAFGSGCILCGEKKHFLWPNAVCSAVPFLGEIDEPFVIVLIWQLDANEQHVFRRSASPSVLCVCEADTIFFSF